MSISRRWYGSLATFVFLFLILLNVFNLQDAVARKFGYAGSVPMFALDQMVRGYTPEKVFQVMTIYGESGRRAYAFLLLTIDLVFPFLYGSFLFLSIRGVANKAGIPTVWANGLAAFGYFAMGCDWLENFAFLRIMETYPGQSVTLVTLASGFTVMKFVFSGCSVTILAGLGVFLLFRSRKRRMENAK